MSSTCSSTGRLVSGYEVIFVSRSSLVCDNMLQERRTASLVGSRGAEGPAELNHFNIAQMTEADRSCRAENEAIRPSLSVQTGPVEERTNR
ncbi:unnamed protein product [Protopolystoma xenopodis]|uniref:Uncharacterized protein n=1 Tax=Protopolystoma xenopodis TaxID=117903 RepID=A0A3S5ALT1_9PLAT|nr:unnamed protein product [Protopolystoma xenopodis]